MERQKLEEEKADLKRKEDKMREGLQVKFDKKEKELQETFDKKQEELKGKIAILEAERNDWEEEKRRVKQTKVFEKVITLNVGGTRYTTTLSTLTKYPDSMLGVMFSGRHDLPQQEDGSYFIDRDGGEGFSFIMSYLRDRDLCFAMCHNGLDALDDHEATAPVVPQSDYQKVVLPSTVDGKQVQLTSEARRLYTKIAYEARYFQLRELETKMLLLLKGYPEWKGSIHYETRRTPSWSRNTYSSTGTIKSMDYGASKINFQYSCYQTNSISLNRVTNGFFSNALGQGIYFEGKILFERCDLSGMTFSNCYFQEGASFEGCILQGTKFERVGGLVRHKVHFAPWQVAQAKFEPELLQALKDNSCIY